MLTGPMRWLGMALGMAQRAVASGARVFEILDRAPRLTAAPDARALPAGGGRVELRDVTFGYDGAEPVLRDIDLDVEPGRDGRARRPDRLRQDDARDADPAPVRRGGGRRARRRRGRARPRPGVAPAARWRVVSDDAFLFSAPLRREHRLRAPRRDRRRDRGRRPSAPASASCSTSCPRASTRWSASAGSR